MLDDQISRKRNCRKRRHVHSGRMRKQGTKKSDTAYAHATHMKKIPAPLEIYAAVDKSRGRCRSIYIISEGLEKIFTKGEECIEIQGVITTPVEWLYKWKGREEEPVLTRRTNTLFLPEEEAIMGKDGSHENCSKCGNGSYKGERLMMCDYWPRAMHQAPAGASHGPMCVSPGLFGRVPGEESLTA